MNELIKINECQIGGEKTHGINARDLWKALEVKTDFNTWIKRRLKKAGFIENKDYVVFPTFGENPKGGRPVCEYVLGIDLSKHISMLEGNEKGREVRQYFIESEKKLKTIIAPQPKSGSLVSQIEAMLAVAKQQEAIALTQQKQQAEIQETKQIAQEALNATNKDIGYVSILGYARSHSIRLSPGQASLIGKALSKYCKENNIRYESVSDAKWGKVNVYPHFVLDRHASLFLNRVPSQV